MSRDGQRSTVDGPTLRSVIRRLLGMPDYEAYLRHMREAHPDRPVLDEREFFEAYVGSRYGDGPNRCC